MTDTKQQEIWAARQQRQVQLEQDTVILQKVNGAHREAFRQKYPTQVEHMMRLTAERLQSVLTKKPKDLTNIGTWDESPEEIRALTEALLNLSKISQLYPIKGE